MPKQIVLTPDGLKNLEEELEQLKTEKRKEIADKIKVALSFGDLSENSEYDEAKNEQGLVESRTTGDVVLAKLTARGADVAGGRAVVHGVKKPMP